MTPRLLLAVVAALAVASDAALYAIALGVRWRATDRRWLRPNPWRRLVRGWRSLNTRYLLWWLSWPRLVEYLGHEANAVTIPAILRFLGAAEAPARPAPALAPAPKARRRPPARRR